MVTGHTSLGHPSRPGPAPCRQWAATHGFVWFSVMDHDIQIVGVGAPTGPFTALQTPESMTG